MSANLRKELIEFIGSIEYDFSRFELNNFIQFLEELRRKPIYLIPCNFDTPELTGIWLPGELADYICYRANNPTHMTHQIHFILHELGHMLLEHESITLDALIADNSNLTTFGLEAILRRKGLLRKSDNLHDDIQEEEAELFSRLIQDMIIEHKRMEQLVRRTSSVDRTLPMTNSMGLDS